MTRDRAGSSGVVRSTRNTTYGWRSGSIPGGFPSTHGPRRTGTRRRGRPPRSPSLAGEPGGLGPGLRGGHQWVPRRARGLSLAGMQTGAPGRSGGVGEPSTRPGRRCASTFPLADTLPASRVSARGSVSPDWLGRWGERSTFPTIETNAEVTIECRGHPPVFCYDRDGTRRLVSSGGDVSSALTGH